LQQVQQIKKEDKKHTQYKATDSNIKHVNK